MSFHSPLIETVSFHPHKQGIWSDSHIEPLKRVVDFAHAHGTAIGVQLQHCGRKGSTYAPWVYANAARSHKAGKWMAEVDEGGWPGDSESRRSLHIPAHNATRETVGDPLTTN